jgi:hypothetical protein
MSLFYNSAANVLVESGHTIRKLYRNACDELASMSTAS